MVALAEGREDDAEIRVQTGAGQSAAPDVRAHDQPSIVEAQGRMGTLDTESTPSVTADSLVSKSVDFTAADRDRIPVGRRTTCLLSVKG